jgi:hypothetical protein
VVTRQWRLARNSALAAAACMIAAAAVYPAMSDQFLTSVMWHLPHLVAYGHTFSGSGNNSVQGILAAIGPWTSPLRTPSSVAVAALGLWAARVCHRRGHELEAWLITGITAQLASPVSWTHHWIWLAPAVLLAALYGRTRVQWTGTALAVVMLFIGSTAGQYLLVHGPAWTLPLAVLQRECLVSAGIWCCVTFLIHAIRAARDRPQEQKPTPRTTRARLWTVSMRRPWHAKPRKDSIPLGLSAAGRGGLLSREAQATPRVWASGSMMTPTKASGGSPNTSTARSAISSVRPLTATSKLAESQRSQRTH